jgi:phospholipase D1/2
MTTLQVGRNTWCETPVESARVIVDGADYYKAFFHAAAGARRSILLSGWQFDSDVVLLRGPDAEGATLPLTLKEFLNTLCEQNPDLEIHILAWDFHVVFALEREWMQRVVFHFTTHERLRFRFDSSHVDRGCHHQKFAVIDGKLSFLGGLDICDARWDRRAHREVEPLRMSRGEPHHPFHDVQVLLEGPEPARRLTELFCCRWKLAGGDPIAIPEPTISEKAISPVVDVGMVIPARRVALSRTDPKRSPDDREGGEPEPCHEIGALYADAIRLATRSLYIETQYFSSKEIGEALVERLKAAGRTPLEIVLVLNMRAETLKEELAVGLAQAKILRDLRSAAEGTAHRLGIYYTVPAHDGDEPEHATYIHSKLTIVDDRFLSIGSANLTNRSGSVDTELNASFEAGPSPTDPLALFLRDLRLDLISEHLGETLDPAALEGDLVHALDERARARRGRLRLHPSPTERERKILDVIDPQALPFDPAGIEDDQERRSLFTRGIGSLFRHVFSDRDDRK